MGTKKSNKLYAAAAALAVTASAVAPGLTADAASKVTVKSITAPKAISHYGGYTFAVKKLSLPKTVKVLLSNKKYENRSVKWGKVSYDKKYIGKYQTISGTVSGTTKKASIKVKLNNYPVDVIEPKLAPVAVGEKLNLPSTIDVKYKDGKVIARSAKSFNLSVAKTDKAGMMKLSYNYMGKNSSIKGSIAYEVKAADISNVKGSVKEDMLSVSADVKYPASGAKAELLVYPGKDETKAISFPAEIKAGKLMAEGKDIPDGTHSYAVKVGDVRSTVQEFKVDTTPLIKEVKATSSKTATVTFDNKLPENVDFNNFEIDGGLIVTEAKVSSDRKSAELSFNTNFTRNQAYTVKAVGLVKGGKAVPESTGKFTWAVAEGVTVALDSTTVEQGETFGLTVKDADGKEVKDAQVTIQSFNTNVLDVNSTSKQAPSSVLFTAQKLAGTVDVEVKTELPDGSVLMNTFKVTVKEAVSTIANAGFTLVDPTEVDVKTADAVGTDFAYANTAAFKAYATASNSVEVGKSADLYAFAETNGNPDASAIDWEDAKNPVTNVKSSNAIVADVTIAGGVVTVKGNSVGASTITVTFKDGSKKTFDIKVTEVAKFKDIRLDQTSIKLSDEAKVSGTNGVDQAVITLDAIDQFGEDFDTLPAGSKVVVSSSTDGITLTGTVDKVGDKITVAAKEGKIVNNAKVTVNYFAKDTDLKPTSTKVITVNVVDVDADVAPSNIDVIMDKNEIDANAANTATTADAKSIAFDELTAYELDAKGNRIGTTTVNDVSLVSEDKNVVITGADTLAFAGTNALTYLRANKTVTLKIGDGDIFKNVNVSYKNTAVLPKSAVVATNAVSITIPTGSTTLEKILFGTPDSEQLVLDNTTAVIAIKKAAKNAGFLYNKPLVSVTGTNGKVLPIGAALYGSTTTELDTSSAIWNNAFINDVLLTEGFAVEGFDYDLAVSNVVSTATGNDVDATSGVVNVTSGNSVTFTLVVKGIYTKGSVANAKLLDATLTDEAAKKEQNLLASPVQLNVSVAGKAGL